MVVDELWTERAEPRSSSAETADLAAGEGRAVDDGADALEPTLGRWRVEQKQALRLGQEQGGTCCHGA